MLYSVPILTTKYHTKLASCFLVKEVIAAKYTSMVDCFGFTGYFVLQLAQIVGMGKTVSAEVPAAKELYDRASSILGYDLYEKVGEIRNIVVLDTLIVLLSLTCYFLSSVFTGPKLIWTRP